MSILHVAVIVHREYMVRKIVALSPKPICELLNCTDETFGMTPPDWCSTQGKRGRIMANLLQQISKSTSNLNDN